MPAGKSSLMGDRLYRFSTQNGAKTSNECLISAHGEGTWGGSFTLDPRITNLYFYTPPRTSLEVGQARGVLNPDGSRSNYDSGSFLISIGHQTAIDARQPAVNGGFAFQG